MLERALRKASRVLCDYFSIGLGNKRCGANPRPAYYLPETRFCTFANSSAEPHCQVDRHFLPRTNMGLLLRQPIVTRTGNPAPRQTIPSHCGIINAPMFS